MAQKCGAQAPPQHGNGRQEKQVGKQCLPVVDFQVIFAEELLMTRGAFNRHCSTFPLLGGLGCQGACARGWLGRAGLSEDV